MTPLINPWVFYLLSVADGVVVASVILVIIMGGAALIWYIATTADADFLGEEELATAMRRVKTFAAVAIVSLIVSIFTPSSKTITQMLVAQNVTYERVEAAGDIVQEVYEDIMGLFEDGEKE